MTRKRIVLLLLVLQLFVSLSLNGSSEQPPGKLTGDWTGWAYFDQGNYSPLRLRLKLEKNQLVARFDEVAAGRYDLPVQKIEWNPQHLILERARPSGQVVCLRKTPLLNVSKQEQV